MVAIRDIKKPSEQILPLYYKVIKANCENVYNFGVTSELLTPYNEGILKFLTEHQITIVVRTLLNYKEDKLYPPNLLFQILSSAMFFNHREVKGLKKINVIYMSTFPAALQGVLNYGVIDKVDFITSFEMGFMHEAIHAYLGVLNFNIRSSRYVDDLILLHRRLAKSIQYDENISENDKRHFVQNILIKEGDLQHAEETFTYFTTLNFWKTRLQGIEFDPAVKMSCWDKLLEIIKNIEAPNDYLYQFANKVSREEQISMERVKAAAQLRIIELRKKMMIKK
jgi:hypothetical protein